jgi:hypothetical protein
MSVQHPSNKLNKALKMVDFDSIYEGFKEISPSKKTSFLYDNQPNESKWGEVFENIMVNVTPYLSRLKIPFSRR